MLHVRPATGTCALRRLSGLKDCPRLLLRFGRDQSGNYLIIAGLLMPILVGLVGLGTEVGLWLYKHQTMQGAADSGAVSAATGYSSNIAVLQTQAWGVTASYGFINGVNGTTVTVNSPPKSGSHATGSSAVEVIVQQPQQRLLSRIYSSAPVLIAARAVATAAPGDGCVLALNSSASGAATMSGSAKVALTGCSLYSNSANPTSVNGNGSSLMTTQSVHAAGGVSGQSSFQTTQGIFQNQTPTADPYANVSMPTSSGCTYTKYSTPNQGTVTLSPGTYCGTPDALKINGSVSVTMLPGIYIIKGGCFCVSAQATVTGDGVTLVFTSDNSGHFATATINGGAKLSLTAPTSGNMAGIVIFGDRNMPVGTAFTLTGGSTQYFGGAIYLPKAALSFKGGSGSTKSCTQIVADTITFTGDANLSLNCSNVKPIGSGIATLVE